MIIFRGGGSMDEKELITRAKNGDGHSFCILYGLYKKKLYSYAYYRLGNKQDAEDAVQNCVLTAFEQIEKLKKAEAFSSWIFRILYCACNKLIKEQINRRNTWDIDQFKNISFGEDRLAVGQELSQALSILSEEERSIVLLSVTAGMKSREIAKITGLTDGNVRQKLSRSLSKMKAYLS